MFQWFIFFSPNTILTLNMSMTLAFNHLELLLFNSNFLWFIYQIYFPFLFDNIITFIIISFSLLLVCQLLHPLITHDILNWIILKILIFLLDIIHVLYFLINILDLWFKFPSLFQEYISHSTLVIFASNYRLALLKIEFNSSWCISSKNFIYLVDSVQFYRGKFNFFMNILKLILRQFIFTKAQEWWLTDWSSF